jgi:hypothetical protein
MKRADIPARERIVELYAEGLLLKTIAGRLGHKSHGYVVRVLSEAREAGDARAAARHHREPRGPRPASRTVEIVAKGKRIIDANGGLGRGDRLSINR